MFRFWCKLLPIVRARKPPCPNHRKTSRGGVALLHAVPETPRKPISKFHRCTLIVASGLWFCLRINLAQMNDSTFTTCWNSVWFESYVLVKFAILSANFCHINYKYNKVPRQTLLVPLDFRIFQIELDSWNFACVFLITFPRTNIFCLSNFEKMSCIFVVSRTFGLKNVHVMHSSPRFLGIFNWATFLKFCMRLPNKIP